MTRKYERVKDDTERQERHRTVCKTYARKKYKDIRTAKWQGALEYLMTLEGEIDDIAPLMADKYNINLLKH